ncbi:hypothetical protein [Bartonella raoultii]|uniref:Trimeric autotransporter adhesin YadA-like stalk domain-containing protein n=1 Tax=Bartonella raoultii TaxID=1457020 RepID=A0ABS7IAE6_9HYPH|nr:hypothetical protein [Bartonella raoultii]MBX4336578.1 hypothetical protein [Bartonella raoultii]
MTNQINNAITNVQGDSLIKKNKETNLITIGKEVAGDEINIANNKNKARILSGVAAGTRSTDAVNFAQLKELTKGWKIDTSRMDFEDPIADGTGSIAIGSTASSLASFSVTLGLQSRATVDDGVAIGSHSVSDVSAGIWGYDPLTGGSAHSTSSEWFSSSGAVSVGDIANRISRQITGVAAGTEDSDAVNVAQLKSLRNYVNRGWKLSVDGKNAQTVGIKDTVDFTAGSNNFTITKGEDDNNVKFDLAKSLTLESVTAGENTFDATGLKIAGGPQITTTGIDAAGKKITGVAEGTDETDAVNLGQLNKTKQEVEKQVAASSFVKQDPETKRITIGKEVAGDEINIANNMNEARRLSGVKEAVNDNEAVNKAQLDTNIKKVEDKLAEAVGNVTQQVQGDALLWSNTDNAFVADHKKDGEKQRVRLRIFWMVILLLVLQMQSRVDNSIR